MSAIASTSDCLKIHNCFNGNLKHYYTSESDITKGPIKSISWGRDGAWILLVPCTGPTEVISVKENIKLLQTIEDIFSPTYAVFQNNTKRNIAIGTVSGEILLYDIKLRNIKKKFPRAPATIFSFKWNSKDSHIAAACINGEIIIYNSVSLNISSTYRVPRSNTVTTINFHNNKRNLLGAGSEEGVIATWDINTNNVLCQLTAHQASVTDLIFSPIRSDLLISSGLDRRLEFYDTISNKCVSEIELVNCATAIDFSSCGIYLGIGSQTGNIILYDTRNFKKPFSSFVAHERKRIRHLLFQKNLITGDSENFSITASQTHFEEAQSSRSQKNLEDSLGLISYDDTGDNKVNNSSKVKSQDNCDSFLAALGLDNSINTSRHSMKNEDVGNIIVEESSSRMDGDKKIFMQNTITCLKSSVKYVASTPKHFVEKLPSITESPVVEDATDLTNLGISLEDFKEAMREVIKTELDTKQKDNADASPTIITPNVKVDLPNMSSTLVETFTDIIKRELQNNVKELKTDLKYDLMAEIHSVRRQILGLQMNNVKQLISIEDKLALLNETLKKVQKY